MASKYDDVARRLIEAVGGRENISKATHCMTRLRLNLVDESKADDDQVRGIDGVMNIIKTGGQYQVVFGPKVAYVYEAVCEVGGLEASAQIDENLDAPKKKLTPKGVLNAVLDYVAGSMSPLLPVIIAAALFETLAVVLGPGLLGIISDTSDLYRLLNILYQAAFYFLPVYLGYCAAKKLGANPMLGLFTGCLLIAPDLIAIAEEGGSFTVYGIPAVINSYPQTVVPILLSVWALSYVERLVKRFMPEILTAVFTPFVTMAIATPIILCVTAPAGSFIGNIIGTAIVSFRNVGGIFAVVIIAVLWEFLVMTGMHGICAMTAIGLLLENGYETLFMPIMCVANYAVFGMTLGAFLRMRKDDEKSMAFGCLISGFFGGVTEPALFQVGLNHRRTFIGMAAGAAAGAVIVGIMNLEAYIMAASNFLFVLEFAGHATSNMVGGLAASILSFAVATVVTYLFGFEKDDPALVK